MWRDVPGVVAPVFRVCVGPGICHTPGSTGSSHHWPDLHPNVQTPLDDSPYVWGMDATTFKELITHNTRLMCGNTVSKCVVSTIGWVEKYIYIIGCLWSCCTLQNGLNYCDSSSNCFIMKQFLLSSFEVFKGPTSPQALCSNIS